MFEAAPAGPARTPARGWAVLLLFRCGRNPSGRIPGKACLVEVKTSRPGIRPDGFRPQGRRGMSPEKLREATRLGFVMLLVTVELTEELTDAWKAIVCDQEIQADD